MRAARLASSASLLAVGLYLIWAAIAVINGWWVLLAIATGLLLLGMRAAVFGAAAGLVFAVYIGQGWLIAAFVLILATDLVPRLVPLWAIRPRTNPTLLVTALDDVDRGLADTFAAVAENEPISTVTLALAAVAEQPAAWQERLDRKTTVAWDGDLLRDSAGRVWTSIAAEAVIFASALATEAHEVSARQVLAAAALMLPESAVGEAITPRSAAGEVASRITGLNFPHLAELTTTFGKGPAGSDAVRRVELRMRLDEERALPGEVLFNASNRQLWYLTLAQAAIRLAAVVAVVGAVLLAPLRGLRRLGRRLCHGPAARVTVPATNPAVAAGPAQPGRAARLSGWLRMTAQLTSWPASVALRFVRPTYTVAAVVFVLMSAQPWWSRILVSLALLLFRPLRRWWLDLALVAAMAVTGAFSGPVLAAAAAIVLRMAVTGAVIGRWGTERAVTEPRRALLPALTGFERDRLPTPDEAMARYRQVLEEDDEFFGDSLEHVASVWATANGLALAGALLKAVRMEFLGGKPVTLGKPLLMRRMRRLAIAEMLTSAGPRWLMVAGSAAIAALTVREVSLTVVSWEVSGQWVIAAFAALLAWLVVRPRPAYRTAVTLAATGLWWLGAGVLLVLTVVVVGAVGAWSLRRAMTRRTVNAPPRLSWVGWRVTGLRYRERYRAASILAARGRPGIAVAVLDEIIKDARNRRPALAAAALAQCSLVELDRGNLQRAVEHAAVSRNFGTHSGSVTASAVAAYAHGIVQFSVGAYSEAVTALCEAEPVLRRRAEGGTCVSVLAQAYAGVNDPDEAMALVAGAATRLTTSGQLLVLVESEVAAGWALLRTGRVPEAKAFIENLVDNFKNPFDDEDLSPDERTRQLWWRLLGQACLLLGRIHLLEGEIGPASSRLDRGAQHLRRTTSPDLLGMTRIYQGECHRVCGQWAESRQAVRSGIELLESRRGQLRAGANRASAVSSGAEHYDTALRVLVDAQHHGDAEAGVVAAGLMESLRRNAFAATLRNGEAAFADQSWAAARATMEKIARLELALDSAGQPWQQELPKEVQSELERLRGQLKDDVSSGFAQAYLPEEVDYLRLSAVARKAHVLQYELLETGPERWRGYRVWVPPDGSPWVDEIVVTDGEALAVLRAVYGGEGTKGLTDQFDKVMEVWAALATALLPAELIRELRDRSCDDPVRLLVVPGEHLAYLPWAPLLLDETNEDTILLHKAIIQVIPSLNLLQPSGDTSTAGTLLAYLDKKAVEATSSGGPNVTAWRRLTSTLRVVRVGSRIEFERQLSDPRYSGIYLIAHGHGTGLAQSIQFSDGGMLSAGAALSLRWPRSMVFGSCFVARVEQQPGQEPFGLVIACMLGGCRTVIGGVIKVERTATPEIAADAAIALSTTMGPDDPAAALRTAQRTFLADWGTAAFVNQWAGLICVSTEWNQSI